MKGRSHFRRFYRTPKPDHMMPVIRVYDAAGNAIETQEQAGDFKEP